MRKFFLIILLLGVAGLGIGAAIFLPHLNQVQGSTTVTHIPAPTPKTNGRITLDEPWKPGSSCAYILNVSRPTVEQFNQCNERLGGSPIALPTNYEQLTGAEQLFVLTDLARISAGEKPIENMVSDLNQNAKYAAERSTVPGPDERGATVNYTVYHSVSAITDNSQSLTPIFDWLFQDGYGGGFNTECNSPQAPRCWGHRRAILSENENLSFGAAWNGDSSAMVIVSGHVYSSKQVIFSWDREKLYLAH